jgi:serine/threonine protein kinase
VKQPIPFGNYLLLERVNIGGMAEVFKAKAFGVEGFERLVAVKRILPSIAEDQEFITMFIDEAKIAVQLSHANICQIFDLGKVGDSFFIAMEFCAGKDVRAIFDRGRKLKETVPIPMACYTIMKVCEGLDYAHNKKDAASRDLHLVHRDVSPQNLLVTWDGEIKIVDFGIAKAANKAGKTQAGILKGKFGYMSPEQVRGLPIDRRSDVFAVGICLYELLTGERLFYGDSDFNTLEMVRNVEIVPATTYNKSIPQELERILLKALAKDVDDRYQTAMDLHDDLQSFMYTSGNFFARKDLSAYMRQTFAEEVAKEAARDEQYRKIKAPAASPPAKGAPKAPPTLPATSGAKATSQGQGPATIVERTTTTTRRRLSEEARQSAQPDHSRSGWGAFAAWRELASAHSGRAGQRAHAAPAGHAGACHGHGLGRRRRGHPDLRQVRRDRGPVRHAPRWRSRFDHAVGWPLGAHRLGWAHGKSVALR